MSELKISEAGSVQFPMVAHAAGIGWTAIGPGVAKQKRGGEEGMLLRDELEAKLIEFNAWMKGDTVRQVLSGWRRSRPPSRAIARCSRG